VTIVPTRRLATLAVLLASAAFVLPAVPAGASGTSPSPSPSPSGTASADARVVTFGIGPASKGKVDRRPNFNLLLTKGSSTSDEVALVNLTYKPITLNLYASDAVNTPDGQLSLKAADDEAQDVAKWVTFKTPTGKGYVVVKPRSTLVVPFTVKVPKDTYVGDHLAGVVASTVTRGQTPGDRTTDVQFEQRIAVRLGVRVAGELAPSLTIENVTASYAGTLNPFGSGTATITYNVHNTGNVRLGGKQKVTVAGLVGSAAVADTVADVPMLLPGSTATVTVPVSDVRPLGPMTATVEIIPLAVAGDANPDAQVATSSVVIWAVPWLLVALIVLLVLVVLVLMRVRRSRRPAATGSDRSRRVAEPVR
jgi:hypothetical protein